MLAAMRRLITLLITAACTATGTLYWLHDGDLRDAVEPVVAEWNAELLARQAGIGTQPGGAPEADAVQEAPLAP